MKHHFVGTKSNSYLSLRTMSALHAQGPRSNNTIMRWKINKIHWLHVVYWNLPVALHNMLQIKKWSISRKGYIIILKIINKYFDVSVFSIKSKFKCINFLKISLRWHSSTYSRSFRYAWIYYANFFWSGLKLIWILIEGLKQSAVMKKAGGWEEAPKWHTARSMEYCTIHKFTTMRILSYARFEQVE